MTHPAKAFTLPNLEKLHPGMPPLDAVAKPVSWFEFAPPWLFYAPVVAHWLFLSLRYRGVTVPTLANPLVQTGGLCGESKSSILNQVRPQGQKWFAPHLAMRTTSDPDADADVAAVRLEQAGLSFPVVAKPDIGLRGAGVQLIHQPEALKAYFRAFPENETALLQDYVAGPGEAGVFYVRRPGAARGRIISLTLKYFPAVVGTGRDTLRALITRDSRAGQLAHLYLARHAARLDQVVPEGEVVRLAFAGSHSRGAIFRNGARFITEAMRAAFDDVANSLPEFHFGRFDVRFADYRELMAGRGFRIVEVNGAGGESTHIWDARTRVTDAWRALMLQNRLLFEIGAENRARGFRAQSAWRLWQAQNRQTRLVKSYPLTH